ncbi:MAG TPA: DUF6635 family protein [Candidatus Polarisedimenticolaceae bacterium]|nr:DUF6635 family protein [Candidatus Polarisedimenticolaceae bacterium]
MDRCIQAYVTRCRERIPSFVESHFSLEQTWRLQRPTLGRDLLYAPLNSAWALPYLALRKAAEVLEKVGYLRPAQWVKHLPSGVKTGYQIRIERLITEDLLEWDRERSTLPQGFLKELTDAPSLRTNLERHASARTGAGTLPELIREFSSGRAIVSDLSGTLLTLLLSWLLLGSTSLSLNGIAHGVAKRDAHDRAASHFFLGRKIGSRFYDVFPPAVHESKVWTILVVLFIALTAGALACTILSDPLRKMLGFHRNRLGILLDGVETELIVLAHKANTKN